MKATIKFAGINSSIYRQFFSLIRSLDGVFQYLIIIMSLEFIIFKCPNAWEIKRALSDEIERCVRNILSLFFWVAAQFSKHNPLKLEQKYFGGWGWEVRPYVALLGKGQRKDAEDPLPRPCQDQTLPGVWEESRCILYQPWGRFLECFGQSAMPRGCPSCASGEQQPSRAAGGALAQILSWSPKPIWNWAALMRGRACVFSCSYGRAGRGSWPWQQISLCVWGFPGFAQESGQAFGTGTTVHPRQHPVL